MNPSEKATLNFYNWEYRHRGYYQFDTPIDIEIPYVPFQHSAYTNEPIIDDGRVPSLIQSFTKLLAPQKQEVAIPQEVPEVEPRFLAFSEQQNLVGVSISFPKDSDILPSRNLEFLNMLSFTEHLLSFEIAASYKEIEIQIVCSEEDNSRVFSQLQAYFPLAIIRNIEIESFGFSNTKDIAIADFGLNDEFMRPIATIDSFSIDPLTSVIATMETLLPDDVAVFQVLFKGITSPIAKDIPYSVSDGSGGSFFADAPEMVKCAQDKIATPLFAVVIRIATQGNTDRRSQYLAQELARSISAVSTSEYNKLIPLSNEGYAYDFHQYNLHHRLSNRLGCILNSKELNTFLHYPNKTIVSKKLGLSGSKTKRQSQASNKGIYIGENSHNRESFSVHLDTETRLSHTHILGVTGVGKSTLIAQMFLRDVEQGLGCAIFDPHGDICDDILKRIPENRKEDVIIIDPSDSDFPIGFNLLEANTDAEKIVLSSDLISAFKRHATAWGDNMTAVLQNAVNTVLESTRGGTLIELKRFLIEEKFRNNYLTSVDDPSLHYYWKNEYPMVRKGIAPLLTRIDTFLRPKLVRYMLAQKKGVDISDCLKNNKIVLLKLSQGLIGEQNSYLLGSLFLAKFNQAALSRQSQNRNERLPYMLYLDEFQNFITPSIERILSGARKYGLGLTIAHQELSQIEDNRLLNSVLSNPNTRICFRLGDNDAKRLESGFSYFEQSDLQSLERGQAIMRIGSSTNDFNLSTNRLETDYTDYSLDIISAVRHKYSTPKTEVEALLVSMLPSLEVKVSKKVEPVIEDVPVVQQEIRKSEDKKDINNTIENELSKQKEEYLLQLKKREEITKHRSLQDLVHTLAIQRGFKSVIEEPTKNGGRVDVGLTKEGIRIGIEISITNTKEYEAKNLIKCIESGYTNIVMICVSEVHLKNIKNHIKKEILKDDFKKIDFVLPKDINTYLDAFNSDSKVQKERIQGYRVNTSYRDEIGTNKINKQQELTNLILSSMRSKKKKK
tara:strand:+ start:54383 stop:57406 length:3024 start_codon:yes stop_codon:yes gene_type:complete